MLNHLPVLLEEVLDHALKDLENPDALYIDATFGGGGYSRALLTRTRGRVMALDQDPEAVTRAQAMEAEFPGRLFPVHCNFADMAEAMEAQDFDRADAVIMDLGLSSYQLDSESRGFSFRHNAPLDMRMDPENNAVTAADLVNKRSEAELADIFYYYGEERRARQVARAVVETRRNNPLITTGQLAGLIRGVERRGKDGIDPATRSFQALRLAVNDELGSLESGLAAVPAILKPGGRLVAVSFHSLEDRIVKRFILEQSHAGTMTRLTKKPVTPTAEECRSNPRARSAKLRAGEASLPTG